MATREGLHGREVPIYIGLVFTTTHIVAVTVGSPSIINRRVLNLFQITKQAEPSLPKPFLSIYVKEDVSPHVLTLDGRLNTASLPKGL